MADPTLTGSDQSRRYFAFRDLMLGLYRDQLATAKQLCMAGELIYGDESWFSLYGLTASELAAHDFNILGRTVVEASIDAHVDALAMQFQNLMGMPAEPELGPGNKGQGAIFDLFCGSGNISYHVGCRLGCPVFASEMDPSVYKATLHNLSLLRKTSKSTVPVNFQLFLTDYRKLLANIPTDPHPTDIYIIEPPWGPAFTDAGLDLTQTSPSVKDIVANIRWSRRGVPCYIALKTTDHIVGDSLRLSMTGSTPVASVTCLPKGPCGIEFHVYICS
ncbi:hypothetical protein IFM61392_08464 [Aspergillus lentulus]|uniref:Uncharacterized protein n=1 Tax=Aspergillus lentulus TaxID=293939 RepID=A0AAN5YUG0_ASPLE|nr:hypothetical protein CNMCM6069_009315 [Aspergillus lentulus]KAF4181849.1 hypothetical protein CNMCM8060_008220 [Aspergillus lentulus]KAF4189799.1 hypothetical protein CNMCM7927_006583 [Aspergillus lentulus]KAF4198107.1 hypothetical protein CNMCM8694_000791 [Aspergillus lentulus]KAF4207649.1 hypothetical protein CNMCM8927_002726 [Aspergillus lentulus]